MRRETNYNSISTILPPINPSNQQASVPHPAYIYIYMDVWSMRPLVCLLVIAPTKGNHANPPYRDKRWSGSTCLSVHFAILRTTRWQYFCELLYMYTKKSESDNCSTRFKLQRPTYSISPHQPSHTILIKLSKTLCEIHHPPYGSIWQLSQL